MATQSFTSPQQYALQAHIKLAGSKAGPCKRCKRNAQRKNPKDPPLHPNCKCQELK